jgi:hypothetical protein
VHFWPKQMAAVKKFIKTLKWSEFALGKTVKILKKYFLIRGIRGKQQKIRKMFLMRALGKKVEKY